MDNRCALLLLSLFAFVPARRVQSYAPPRVVAAGDAYSSYQAITDGLVVLDVSLSASGNIQQVTSRRDPGGLFPLARTVVSDWTFRPASQGAKPVPSRMSVFVVYRPSDIVGDAGSHLPPPEASPNRRSREYTPAALLSYAYAEYPVNSVAWGSVVVSVSVDEGGRALDVHFLHRMPGFDRFPLDALKKWRFHPAMMDGKPIASNTAIAFVFQTPTSSSR